MSTTVFNNFQKAIESKKIYHASAPRKKMLNDIVKDFPTSTDLQELKDALIGNPLSRENPPLMITYGFEIIDGYQGQVYFRGLNAEGIQLFRFEQIISSEDEKEIRNYRELVKVAASQLAQNITLSLFNMFVTSCHKAASKKTLLKEDTDFGL